jgi:integrase
MLTLAQAASNYLNLDRVESTISTYRSAVEPMVAAIGPSRDIHRIDLGDLLDYTASVRPGLKASSFKHYVTCIKIFFNWCVKMHYLEVSPAAGLVARLPDEPPRDRAIPPDVLEQMLVSSQNDPHDYALLLFLADTGARRGGVASLTLDHLDLPNESALIRNKGGRFYTVYFSEITATALHAWIDVRPMVDHEFVWISRSKKNYGRAIRPETISRMCRRRSRAVCGTPYGPHSIRHAVGHGLAHAGTEVTITQRKLGHRSVRTTLEHYYPNTDKHVRDLSHAMPLPALRKPRNQAKIVYFPRARDL